MKTNPFLRLSLLMMATWFAVCNASAAVILPAYLSDNMVVQQRSTLIVKGKSTHQGRVTVTPSWDKKTITGNMSADGTFAISLATPKAGGPYEIVIDDGDRRVLSNVLVGEVWFCSGQSNMEMPVKGGGRSRISSKNLLPRTIRRFACCKASA